MLSCDLLFVTNDISLALFHVNILCFVTIKSILVNVNNIITSLSPINLFTVFWGGFSAINYAVLTVFVFVKLFMANSLKGVVE